MLIGQMAALAALMWGAGLSLAQVPDIASDGVAVILIVCISTPVQVLVLALMSLQTGASATDYLALRLPRKIEVVAGVVTVLIFVAGSDGITWLIGRDIVSQFQFDIYRTASTAGYLPWLWFTLVVIAPIGEETLFRGFLFRGWHRVPRDVWPVIIVTALIWAFSHLQYDLYFMAQVFVSGLVLGWFRWSSGSTILSMLLHGLLNFEGTLETLMVLQTNADLPALARLVAGIILPNSQSLQ
jgi:membrane protease YdiL (CAAX protease family)